MITVLYCTKDSIYKQLDVDVWDIDRDARLYTGSNVIIGHPPCRAWGRLKYFAKPRHDEKQLAIDCIALIRKNGGILEHPRSTGLWKACDLPLPGQYDSFNGFSLCLDQSWFGHKCVKRSLFYIKGMTKDQLPEIPIRFDAIEYILGAKNKCQKELPKKEREKTPLDLAKWMHKIALIIEKNR